MTEPIHAPPDVEYSNGAVSAEEDLEDLGWQSAPNASRATQDEVFHVKIEEVQHKCLQKDARALKDLKGMVDTLPMIANLGSTTHKGIVESLLSSMYPSASADDLAAVLQDAIPPRREDGLEVWQEIIEGRGFVVVLVQSSSVLVEANKIAMARLRAPLDLSAGGSHSENVRYVGLAVGPPPIDSPMRTRTVFETGRSLAAVLSEPAFRLRAQGAHDEAQLHRLFSEFCDERQKDQHALRRAPKAPRADSSPLCVRPFSGLIDDVRRRLKWYGSDFTEAWGYKGKVLSTAIYLFCVILAPAIAFGSLMREKTDANIGPMEILISQSVSGLIFSLFGGCPFVIIMTTGPLTVFIGFLYDLTESMGIEFLPFYAWVGVWNTFWLLLSVMFNLSNHIHYVTAFVDQIFACLVAGIFAYEAIKPTGKHFFTPSEGEEAAGCMGVVLMLGTFIASVKFMSLRASSLLSRPIRELASDYGTAIALVAMSGVYHIAKVDHVETLKVPNYPELTADRSIWVDMTNIPLYAVFVAAGPAFLLFTLFFLDENITSILSNKPEFKLRKGEAMHLDLFVVAIINLFLGMTGLPFLHGALPQSPLHVMQLAEHEEFLEQVCAFCFCVFVLSFFCCVVPQA